MTDPKISLTKGGNISLTKQNPGLQRVTVGLGWDARTTAGDKFDLDASAFGCNGERKLVSQQHFVFYNNSRSPDGSIIHSGDNRTGEGEGDDEQIYLDLTMLPENVMYIPIAATIYPEDQGAPGPTFGQVRNAFIRVFETDTGTELARFDLAEDASTETAMVFGEVYRNGSDWKFRAVGQGYADGLNGVAREFGANV